MESISVELLAICGSTRAGGNTDQMLQFAAEVARLKGASLKTLNLRDYNFAPSSTCGDCNYRETPCELTDDMALIIEQMRRADGIIYAVPVHGFGMGHLMQMFIERSGVCFLRFDRPLTNKVGGAVIIGRRYNHSNVHSQIVSNLLLNRMIIVGSGFPAVLHGGRPNEVWDDLEGLDSARRMVNRMIDMVRTIKHYLQLTDRSFLTYEEANERTLDKDQLFLSREQFI
ncbi:flavodoxin family protein [Paenibacillus tarimensis]|uniref:flavodoxin family protein n=1 Tax=Paenibacillus tarimensis TaxID=416012 RepID=UPI001F407B3D|nr:flavodoxin family protein [Paenibacillus tarimensis]MCF2943327.1 flavodoxin family protein [Paenibacillus tarimensis]